MRKHTGLNNLKHSENYFGSPEEELHYILWKAELGKELISFWKAISK